MNSDTRRFAPEIREDRKRILDKIAVLEREKRYDVDVEDDPPTTSLDYKKVDYLGKKPFSKLKTAIANRIGYRYFDRMIKDGEIIIDDVVGIKNAEALSNGGIVTCNHFAFYDNFIVYKALYNVLPRKRLYKIIREGNYTAFKGLYGFLFRNCNTLPLSGSLHGLKAVIDATCTLLTRGECVLIYPEEAMWWNYRKPRPFKSGAFMLACKANVPVLPIFISMTDDDRVGCDGYPVQRHVVHVMPPVYPRSACAKNSDVEKLRDETFELYKNKYAEIYGTEYSL